MGSYISWHNALHHHFVLTCKSSFNLNSTWPSPHIGFTICNECQTHNHHLLLSGVMTITAKLCGRHTSTCVTNEITTSAQIIDWISLVLYFSSTAECRRKIFRNLMKHTHTQYYFVKMKWHFNLMSSEIQ